MRHNYNVTGADRKRLVGIISRVTGVEAEYKFTPTYAYEIGPFSVDREGTLTYDDDTDSELVARVLQAIELADFTAEDLPEETRDADAEQAVMDIIAEPAAEIAVEAVSAAEDAASDEAIPESGSPQEPDTNRITHQTSPRDPHDFTVEIPRDKVDTCKLANLLEAKGALIEKALGVTDLTVEIADDKVIFPWFTGVPEADAAVAYVNFISALCRMTLEQKRISAKERPSENEKYAFRCFLLRLGFIGDEYKKDRKVLLQNLTGNSSFKAARKEAHDEISA